MKTLFPQRQWAVIATATGLLLGAANLYAQGQGQPPQGNFDPTQMRQRMLERLRTQLGITDDSEWKLVSERIAKVNEARRNVGGGGPGGMGGGLGGPGGMGGGPPGPGGMGGGSGGPPSQATERNAAGTRPTGPDQRPSDGQGGPGFGRENNPELDALRKAIEAKASTEEIKAKLAELRAARKAKEAELEKAQESLRQVLTARQEAIAVVNGLLK